MKGAPTTRGASGLTTLRWLRPTSSLRQSWSPSGTVAASSGPFSRTRKAATSMTGTAPLTRPPWTSARGRREAGHAVVAWPRDIHAGRRPLSFARAHARKVTGGVAVAVHKHWLPKATVQRKHYQLQRSGQPRGGHHPHAARPTGGSVRCVHALWYNAPRRDLSAPAKPGAQ